MDTQIDWIPGIKNILFRDLPTFVRTTDPNDPILNFALKVVAGTYEATALVFNTFDELDVELLDAFKSQLSLPPIYTIGPIHNLHNQIPNHQLQSIGSNLWKEETKCLEWLESKKPDSVLYVNFGSIAVMTAQQLVEFAWGLANTKHTFLWIIRPDLVVGESAMLPPEFIEETKERDQQTNCSYLCNHWGVGMEIDNKVKRNEVEKLVRELMEGEIGNEMKSKAMEWKKKAEVATSPGGSSYTNIDEIINKLLRECKITAE
ncbi:7-deoxyloganetin glucosyltransferase-like isoform X2 [Papaver somniferum]|uniref:7-deoxyloganetin glucosyltransferase-like isoform X2 n=1 Tax=Papaver somniferum TaxID=3469 RepID=UPI000E6F5651|nr:7-deoxyloganetin glucosyltransferase-like isoform X2 [Papaver somniferum]